MVHARCSQRWGLLLPVAFGLTLAACDDGTGPGGDNPPVSAVIDPGGVELRIGESSRLGAAYLDAAGLPVPLPAAWTPVWHSSDTTVVAVLPDGTAQGRRVGNATVTLTAGPLTDQASAVVLGPVGTSDPVATVSATVDALGGSITTSTSSGARYTLAVPPGALDRPVEITLAPLTGMANLPLSGGLAAGLELQPDGLRFLIPAVLTVLTPEPVDPAGLVGFVVSGQAFRMVPVRVRSDTLTLMVGHFSSTGVGTGEAAEIDALAALPAASTEDGAMQDLAAAIAEAGASGTGLDPVWIVPILGGWYDTSVAPGLVAASSDPDRLEEALGEFARWANAVALWADGLFEAQLEAGRALAAAALRAEVERLNQQCAEQNDPAPVTEILRWVSVAELMGLTTADNGLQVDSVVAGLCLQIEILEAELPESIGATGSITLDVRAGLSIGGRSAAFDRPLNVDVDAGSTALVSPPLGATDGSGRFTAQVSLQHEANDAVVDVAVSLPDLFAVRATRRLTAAGGVTLELTGRPGGSGAPPSDFIEIEAGKDAHLSVTLLKGRGGYAGKEVLLELEGAGSLNTQTVGVDASGTMSAWYTAPASGRGDAFITAKFLADGELLQDRVHVQYDSFEPVDLELDFGTGEPSPTVEGPVLSAGVDYIIRVSGTYSIWTSEWNNGACKGSPGSSPGGPTGLDAENFFAIPVGSVLCGSSFDCCPNHTSKFRMDLGTGGFAHIHPEGGRQYNASHEYEYRVTGQGNAIRFQIVEDSARGDDYGMLYIHIERAATTSVRAGGPSP